MSTAETPVIDLHSTPPEGGDDAIVKTLEIWSGPGTGDASDSPSVLKGIRITWFNGESDHVYNHPQEGGTRHSYKFKRGETADFGAIFGWRIVRLWFETNLKGYFVSGGENGHTAEYIANGYLVGFEGSSGWEMDSLSLRYNVPEAS
ncbi:hypothetical protein BDV26DRAFT_288740 [Aspergillus bertholletiae]|uniref:Jacalin-type lectin domain-containing protein n=1 Tax=Aspergillus bertholletiae TaxID=1226010 RepID=A0A5N7BKC4_9EURO|nr:hypothetical protein BDV26DRAFT_288740 [Aspergillus bertholletiae]